jgi:hypothetical protein
LLAFGGFEKLPDAFPIGGHAGAKVGPEGKDQIEVFAAK